MWRCSEEPYDIMTASHMQNLASEAHLSLKIFKLCSRSVQMAASFYQSQHPTSQRHVFQTMRPAVQCRRFHYKGVTQRLGKPGWPAGYNKWNTIVSELSVCPSDPNDSIHLSSLQRHLALHLWYNTQLSITATILKRRRRDCCQVGKANIMSNGEIQLC